MLPAILWIILVTAGFTHTCICHGQPRSPENAPAHFIAIIISAALLYWGGFFNSLLGIQ